MMEGSQMNDDAHVASLGVLFVMMTALEAPL